jgi:protein phosphatase PTC7
MMARAFRGRTLLARSFSSAPFASAPLHLVFGSCGIPHPEKAAKGGEDAYFADDELGLFGCADGVGGSASDGVDPGVFSRELLRECHTAMKAGAGDLQKALSMTGAGLAGRDPKVGGSSTLVLGHLDSTTCRLNVLNLGDSGVLLLRPSTRQFSSGTFNWPRVVMRTHDQTHYFNCPYQLATAQFGRVAATADELSVLAQAGDVVIAATDGVLDNMFDMQIQLLVAQHAVLGAANQPGAVQAAVDDLARQIAKAASGIGHREDEEGLNTPFQTAAAQEGYKFLGGKLDDVAVVCGVVCSGERLAEKRVMHNFVE